MVTPVSVEDIKNLWEIRFALEVMATKKAVDNMTDKDFQELRRLQNQFEELDAKDKTNIIRVNSNLHMHIITDTAAEYVSGIFRRLREHEYDPRLMRLYVVGGGGCLIRNFGNYDERLSSGRLSQAVSFDKRNGIIIRRIETINEVI